MRDDLGKLMDELRAESAKFDESKQRYLERQARVEEKVTARKVVTTPGARRI